MFSSHVLIHTHVPKCGGGTINHGLMDMIGKDRVLLHKKKVNDNGAKRSRPVLLSEEERREIYAYVGHFRPTNEGIALFDREPLYIASVRDPLRRLASTYAWISSSPNLKLHTRMKGMSFEEAARMMIEVNHPSTRNSQCMQLGGEQDFEVARKRLEDSYLAVVTCESVETMLGMFARAFGHDDVQFAHKHLRTKEPPTLTPETEAKIRELTAEDAKLAAWVDEAQAEWIVRGEQRLRALLDREASGTSSAKSSAA